MQPSAIHENDNDMISNYDNSSNFASSQSLGFTPDNMGDKMKKGTYIWVYDFSIIDDFICVKVT